MTSVQDAMGQRVDRGAFDSVAGRLNQDDFSNGLIGFLGKDPRAQVRAQGVESLLEGRSVQAGTSAEEFLRVLIESYHDPEKAVRRTGSTDITAKDREHALEILKAYGIEADARNIEAVTFAEMKFRKNNEAMRGVLSTMHQQIDKSSTIGELAQHTFQALGQDGKKTALFGALIDALIKLLSGMGPSMSGAFGKGFKEELGNFLGQGADQSLRGAFGAKAQLEAGAADTVAAGPKEDVVASVPSQTSGLVRPR